MTFKRKGIAFLLMLCLMFSLVPANALAQESDYTSDIIDVIGGIEFSDSSDIGDSLDAQDASRAAKTKAIVIIPGILGSSLKNSSTNQDVWLNIFNYGQMALNENGTSVNSVVSVNHDNYGANNTYKTLYNSLKNAYSANFDVIFFDYDWRMSNTTAASNLASELSGYTQVVLVAHSMGGLVASKFLSNSSANRTKTAALITLGTPYVGSAKCINVMETGELIGMNLLGINITLFGTTVKNMSKNSNAGYQLLPTSKYYTITGAYPVSYNGTNYTTSDATLKNTAWGKKSNGTAKDQFATATTFHSALFNSSGTHVKNFSDVDSYTIAMTGHNTISRVNLGTGYAITSLTYSNTGDGTVLYKSAGYGTPDFLYTGPDHTGMVSDSTIIAKIKTIITAETGVAAAKSGASDAEDSSRSNTRLIDVNNLNINARGWIEGTDNKRINLYADSIIDLSVGGVKVETIGDCLYANGRQIGNIWLVGDTGKMLYVLNNDDYSITSSGYVKVEYMESGYFAKIVEYDFGKAEVVIEINDFASKNISIAENSGGKSADYSTYVYSDVELATLNSDN